MNPTNKSLVLAYLNCRGQSGFNESKQLQVENFIKCNNIDILHLQESHLEDETFSQCKFILSNFTIIKNNSPSRYGTACLVKSSLPVEDIILHHSGRIILFNVGGVTFGNVYLPSGSDGQSRSSRENFCGEIVPNLLINSKQSGIIGGDWNNILAKEDCTRQPENKLSPCLKRLVSTFSWIDCYRHLHPSIRNYSHYYSNHRAGTGATRIDRCYSWGEIVPVEAKYVSIAFSDHMSHIVRIELPEALSTVLSLKTRPVFKTRPEVVRDKVFQNRLTSNMKEWEEVRRFGVPVLTWWEALVKPGIRKLAIERGKELNRERRAFLNLLMLRQAFLTKKVHSGEFRLLPSLKEVQVKIENWFETELQKVKYQARVNDIQISEKVRIYHHELHQKHIKRSAILKLETEQGLIEGHKACSEHLQRVISTLLQNPADLDKVAQNILLAEVDTQFTTEDNNMLAAEPTKDEVKASIDSSNLHAAPGTDGITSYLYKDCFDILGDAVTDVVRAVFLGQQPTTSQRTSLMVCTSKPGKEKSLKVKDKRRLSLLNADFKIITGVEVGRYSKVLNHTLSPQQIAMGDDRRISFGICLARDAIYAASMRKEGCAIADNDFEAAFDYLSLEWVKMVLERKGLTDQVISRFVNIYSDGITIPMINNTLGPRLNNIRLSLRQGDRPSGIWFCYGIDPLLNYLENRLTGIVIHSLPVSGPAQQGMPGILQPRELRYKVQGYLDDCKPAITTMAEFSLVDKACELFEKSSGCRLHRNPASNKCKVLLLGRWKGTLQQEDIPLPYLKVTDHLDFLGCKLFANYCATRRENGEILKKKVKDQIGSWKSGKFLQLTSRPWSLNSYCLPKLWYRTGCIDLRVGDSSAITSTIKSWLFQDMLEKPQEMVTFRQVELGGLGLQCVKTRAMAMLIRTFLQQAISAKFQVNQYHQQLYKWHVLEERDSPCPGKPPYYSATFFHLIKIVKENTPLNIATVSVKQWYQLLMEMGVTHTSANPNEPPQIIATKLEEKFPGVDLSDSYRLARVFGLSPDQKSFIFKMMQSILPTRDRLARIGKVQSSNCQYCDQIPDSTVHLLTCNYSTEVTTRLQNCLATYLPGITPQDITRLHLPVSESLQLSLTWLISTCLMYVWEQRIAGKAARLDVCRAELFSRLMLLRDTKWRHYTLHNCAVLLEDMLNLHFS